MNKENNQLFYKYFDDWFQLFKATDVRPITAQKYEEAENSIKELAPELTLAQANRMEIQKLLLAYGKTHEIGTAKSFFHMVRACLQNAKYDGLIDKDPTFKLKATSSKKHKSTRAKFLEREEAQSLEQVFRESDSVASDMFDFDMRTGLRFAELLGLTPADINEADHRVRVNKSWLYKLGNQADFGETKNSASHRNIAIDDVALDDIKKYLTDCGQDEPFFVKALSIESGYKPTAQQKYKAIYHATLNRQLTKFCEKAEVPRVGIHGLRHTHASLLLYAGVSIISISKRLGHANTTTTEKVYLHLIKDKKEKDDQKIIKVLDSLDKQ